MAGVPAAILSEYLLPYSSQIPPDVVSARRELSVWDNLITEGDLDDALQHNLAGPLVSSGVGTHM